MQKNTVNELNVFSVSTKNMQQNVENMFSCKQLAVSSSV